MVIQYPWLAQNLSKRFLKHLTVSAETTWFERLFHISITRLVKLNFLSHHSSDVESVYV